MGRLDTINAFTAAFNAQRWDAVANYLADDFTWMGPGGKQGFLTAQKVWFAAAPDYHATVENAREDGDAVHYTLTMAGTQTNTLTLPGRPPIAATGKRFSATYPTTVTWRGDKMAAMSHEPSSTPPLLEQLGVQPPA